MGKQIETLQLLCSLHKRAKPEDIPDVCNLIMQHHHQFFTIQDTSSQSHFNPFTHLTKPHHESQQVHTSPSISLALMLGGVFLILFITALITCFKHKKESEVSYQVFENLTDGMSCVAPGYH